MRRLTLEELLALHAALLERHGGVEGILNAGAVDSALHQPFMTFGGEELYPTPEEKACARAFSLICNHAFRDGNKRIGYAAMDVFLRLNGFKLKATADDAEAITLGVASHRVNREEFLAWIRSHLTTLE
jgi:death-on-curing protein